MGWHLRDGSDATDVNMSYPISNRLQLYCLPGRLTIYHRNPYISLIELVRQLLRDVLVDKTGLDIWYAGIPVEVLW